MPTSSIGFDDCGHYFEKQLDPKKPAIWMGDVNVAPEPIDVYHPDRRVNDPDFHIDARNAYKATVAWGFIDVYRKFHPDVVQYTYWDYYRNAVERNFGWRIDHILGNQASRQKMPQSRSRYGRAEGQRSFGPYNRLGGVRRIIC